MTTFTVHGTVGSYYVGPGNTLNVAAKGAVLGAAGAYGANYGPGGPGGAAVTAVSAQINNSGAIRGGEGGYGGDYGGAGGAGGVGVSAASSRLVNNATVSGGAGGDGGYGGAASNLYGGTGGQGGSGGAGATLSSGTMTNRGVILAGSGGSGGGGGGGYDNRYVFYVEGYGQSYMYFQPAGGAGGAGGDGGVGLALSGTAGAINSGTIKGGAGGSGGGGGSYGGGTAHSGSDGGGGAGVTLGLGTLVNRGQVQGGTSGGVGVEEGAGGVVNTGTVTGGSGAVGMTLTTGRLSNSGVIDGGVPGGYPRTTFGDGVQMTAAGTVINLGAGVIQGGAGTSDLDIGGYLGGVGILASDGGLVDNQSKGTIAGGRYGGPGVAMTGGSLVNAGLILGGSYSEGTFGTAGDGVVLTSVDVNNSGTIRGGASEAHDGYGGVGISMTLGSVTNTGMIVGGAAGLSDGIGGTGVVEKSGLLVNEGSILGGAASRLETGGTGAIVTGGLMINKGSIAGAVGGYYDRSATNGGVGAKVGYAEFTKGTLINDGHIVGGAGQNITGTPRYSSEVGDGGAGVDFTDFAPAYISNSGVIAGGAGGNDGVAGSGVTATGDGSIVNRKGGTISGYYGVKIGNGSFLTVTNAGLIEGTEDSVLFTVAQQTLVVDSGAEFIGAIVGGDGTLAMSGGGGTISGLGGSGTLSGTASGTFSAFGSYEVENGGRWTLAGASQTLATGKTLTVDDARLIVTGDLTLGAKGTISGAAGANVTNLGAVYGGGVFYGPMAITNAGSGVIDDDVGTMIVNNQNGAGVVNNGLIESTGTGDLGLKAVTFTGTGRIVDGTEIKLEGAAIDGGTLTIDAGATLLTTAAGDTIAAAVALTNAGDIDARVGGLTIDGSVDNTGLMQADSGDLTIEGAVTGAGQLHIVGDGVLTLGGTSSEAAVFVSGATGELVIGTGYSGRVTGFSTGGANTIDLADIVANGWKFSGSATSGNLFLYDGKSLVDTVKLFGDYLASTFTLTSDGAGGTLVTDPPAPGQIAQAMAGFGTGGSTSSSTPNHASATPLPTLALPFG